ncbi:MarR family winged helix-turn-helix transcriptional regulator [Actinomadura kijaniata]
MWDKYRTLLRELQAAQDHQLLRASGLSAADYALLVPLSESARGLMRSRELAAEVGWERSRVSHQVSRMARRGLVVREPCADDARAAMVRLTRRGRDAVEAAAPRHREIVRRLFFAPLSPEEIGVLEGFLDRMLTAVDREARR